LAELEAVSGVAGLLYWKNAPALVPSVELESLRHFLQGNQLVELERIPINAGKEADAKWEKSDALLQLVLPSLGFMVLAKSALVAARPKRVRKRTGLKVIRLAFSVKNPFRRNRQKFKAIYQSPIQDYRR
jgi:hypothetical protein